MKTGYRKNSSSLQIWWCLVVFSTRSTKRLLDRERWWPSVFIKELFFLFKAFDNFSSLASAAYWSTRAHAEAESKGLAAVRNTKQSSLTLSKRSTGRWRHGKTRAAQVVVDQFAALEFFMPLFTIFKLLSHFLPLCKKCCSPVLVMSCALFICFWSTVCCFKCAIKINLMLGKKLDADTEEQRF